MRLNSIVVKPMFICSHREALKLRIKRCLMGLDSSLQKAVF